MSETPGRILFLCTGNICRSALGHHRLASALQQQVPGAYEISSAGTHMNRNLRVPQQILDVAGEELVPGLQEHTPRQLRRPILAETDLLLAATEEHIEYVLQEAPAMLNRSFTVLEFGVLAQMMLDQDITVDGDLKALARAAARMRSTARQQLAASGSVDLDDPYGGPDEGYAVMTRALSPALESITALLVRQAR